MEAERQKRQRESSEQQQAEPRSAREVVRNTASTHYAVARHLVYSDSPWGQDITLYVVSVLV